MHLLSPARALARLAALGVGLALVAGCAAEPAAPGAAPGAAPSGVVGARATTSPAAELQAGLTALLVERVWVVADLTRQVAAADGALEAPLVVPAREALDASSSALADLLGATYSTARAPLQDGLRQADRLLAEHAAALAAEDALRSRRTREELDGAYADLGEVVRRVVPTLDAQEVTARLAEEAAQVAGGGGRQLRPAAASAAGTARLLAAGIAADRGLGEAGTPAARLRTDLTWLLTEHVRLVGAGDWTALQDSTGALGDLLGSSYPALRAVFVRSWQAHVDRLERYATARAAGGDGAAELGLVRGYPAELARLLGEHVDGLPPGTWQAELEPALQQLLAAVDAGGTPEQPSALHDAATAVLPVAALLAAAVAEDLRLA